jgi:hypothetical protein
MENIENTLKEKYGYDYVDVVLESTNGNMYETQGELFEAEKDGRRFYILRDGTEVLTNNSGKFEEFVFDACNDEDIVCREFVAEEDIKYIKTNNVIPFQKNHFLATKLKKEDIIKMFTEGNTYSLSSEEEKEFMAFMNNTWMAWFNAYRSSGYNLDECIQNIENIGFGNMANIIYLKVELHQEYENQYDFNDLSTAIIKEIKDRCEREDWQLYINVVFKDSKYIKPKEFSVFALTFMPE